MPLTRRDFARGMGALGFLGAIHPLTGPGALSPGGLVAHAASPPPRIPELEVAGSPGAIGHTHGRRFAAQIKDNVGFYIDWLSRATGRDSTALLRIARRFGPVLKRLHPNLLEEIQGIARGAGRSLDEILLVNARTDMLVLAARKARPKTRNPQNPGCTALALLGQRGKRPLLALGQNWDWRKNLQGRTLILRIAPRGGPRIVTFTEAGMVGKIGFNEHRLGVCLNFLSHDTDAPGADPGVPVHCLLRLVMGCKTVEEAHKLVAWSPRCASANFLIAQHAARTEVLDLEVTPAAVGRLRIPKGGTHLVHTNHYLGPALSPGCTSGTHGPYIYFQQNAYPNGPELSRTVWQTYFDPLYAQD